MIRKTIKYKNFDNEEVTEDFFFNMTQAEFLEMEINADGTLADELRKISESNDIKEIYAAFKKIVLGAYGEKTADGKRFIKSEEISNAFSQTEAYSELLLELMNAEKAAEFVNALVPKDVAKMAHSSDPRAVSEAAMQGYKKPKEKSKDFEKVADLPAAAPVLGNDTVSHGSEYQDDDLSNLSREQLENMLRGPGGQSFLK